MEAEGHTVDVGGLTIWQREIGIPLSQIDVKSVMCSCLIVKVKNRHEVDMKLNKIYRSWLPWAASAITRGSCPLQCMHASNQNRGNSHRTTATTTYM